MSVRFELLHHGGPLVLGDGVTRVMGVVNVTPDSFYALSRAASLEVAVERALAQVEEGAAVIDVGGESTRPGAERVAADEERARVVPVIERLAARSPVAVSVDTYKAEVARAAVAAGAVLVNDVSGGRLDPTMAATVAELGVGMVVGHLRGTPATMQQGPFFTDVVAEVRDELAARLEALVAAGIARERILLDPGIGFGKRGADNLVLLARLGELAVLGRPLVVGVSRKQFLADVLTAAGFAGAERPDGRLEASLAAAALAAAGGASLVRTHDVAATRRALAIADAILHHI